MFDIGIRSNAPVGEIRRVAAGIYRPSHAGSRHGLGWRPDFARIRGKVYIAIAQQIEEAIHLGILRPGDKLPSLRIIADELGFSVNTINAAFKEAARRGLVRANAGSGTIVLP
ncbi:winged helix-turn-helix domain-containing protein [Paraburkholderia edwinii]|uniref:Winged helix-turn-helix domain-containing protein n=1 Tax=Paraburkholderia edwinii TaxID=2861782 RepID=A0ABX8UQU0_9BURK|nr:winged helix-turn-helix domain-containing protein [Paraburkholderia edwinii]QYD71354.1 winged helix-turn-helix domain-containing protein [Paraburkholderia edwinii]